VGSETVDSRTFSLAGHPRLETPLLLLNTQNSARRNDGYSSNISDHFNQDYLVRIPKFNLSRKLRRDRVNDLFRRNAAPTLLQRNPECLINTHLSRAADNRCANTRNVTRNHLFHRFHLENVSELPRPILENRPELRRSEEHTSELQSRGHLVCRLLLEKK